MGAVAVRRSREGKRGWGRVSKTATADEAGEMDRVVRNTSQFARSTLHRLDENADEPRPACPEAEIRDGDDFAEVEPGAYPTYDRCQNPECFGEAWW